MPRHGVWLIVVTLLGGCAMPRTAPPVVWSVSEEARAAIRIVAVAPDRSAPKPAVTSPAKGAGEGAGRGAALGALAPVAAGGQTGSAYGVVLGVLLAPFTAVIGSGIGAANAVPAEQVEKAEQAVNAAFAASDFHALLAAAVRMHIVADTGYRVVETQPGPESTNSLSDFVAATGADAVIDLDVTKVAIEGPWSIDPPITFVLEARARLIRPSGSVLWNRRLSYKGPKLTLGAWAENDADALRNQIALSTSALAERIVDDLFLLHIPPGMEERPR